MPSGRTIGNRGVWGEPWRARAACRHEDAQLFFPVGVTGAAVAQIAAAKAVCARCPVLDACRAFALSTNQEYGIWGGWDEEERRDQRRRWRRQAAGGAQSPVAS